MCVNERVRGRTEERKINRVYKSETIEVKKGGNESGWMGVTKMAPHEVKCLEQERERE